MLITKLWEMLRSKISPEPVDHEKLWNQLVKARGCIKCNKEPKGFYEGPTGGMSVNVFCTQCGQGYNLSPIIHWAELIHKDERYIEAKQSK